MFGIQLLWNHCSADKAIYFVFNFLEFTDEAISSATCHILAVLSLKINARVFASNVRRFLG